MRQRVCRLGRTQPTASLRAPRAPPRPCAAAAVVSSGRALWTGAARPRPKQSLWSAPCELLRGGAQANDAYGNERGVGGDTFSVRIFPPGTRTAEGCRIGCSVQGRPQQAVVVDNTDSSYSVEYTQYDTGNHTVFADLLLRGGVQATYYGAPNISDPVSARAASQPGGSSLSLVGWQSPSLTAGLPGACFAANGYSVRWAGYLSPTQDAVHTFQFQRSLSISGDRMRLWVDNSVVVEQWTSLGSVGPSGTITLEAFAYYDLWVDYKVQTVTVVPHSVVVRGACGRTVRTATLITRKSTANTKHILVLETSPGKASAQITKQSSPFAHNSSRPRCHALRCRSMSHLSSDLCADVAAQLEWNAGLSSVNVVPSSNLYEGYPLQGSPFPVLVLPALTCASLSIATPNQPAPGGSLELATAGMQAEFSITSKDQYGNLRMVGGDLYRVRFTGTQAVGGVVQVCAAVLLMCSPRERH